ncbi:DinB family protein [Alteribacter populi]|uniref:DinB family protein n=1 Tax=Alteribacter populi TaxID=2011011 RepID=UPI000BBA7B99|nr:DinB family protein [Alteribacter populi]
MEKRTLDSGPSRDSLYLLDGLIQTREKLLTMIDKVDEEDLYFHVPQVPTVAGYLLHLAQIELWWNKEVLRQQPLSEEDHERFLFQEKQEIVTPPKQEKAWFLSRLGEARMLTREHFMMMSDMEFKRPSLEVVLGDEETYCSPEWVLYHLIDHESYHRGQMALIFTLMNGKREKWDHFTTPYLSL